MSLTELVAELRAYYGVGSAGKKFCKKECVDETGMPKL